MKGELHIPDLPEVPVALGPPHGPPSGVERRARPRWVHRLRETLAGYIPLLLMSTLALLTWLVAKNAPGMLTPSAPGAASHDPDYTVDHFTLQRFDVTGALKVEIEGDSMQHFPDDSTMVVEKIRVVSIDPDGHRITASALHGRATDDSSQVWLDGQAQVVSQDPGELPVQMNGEHLRAEPKLKLVESDSPVIVQQGGSEFHAEGLLYDHNTRIMTLRGRAHALLQPELRKHAPASAPARGKP